MLFNSYEFIFLYLPTVFLVFFGLARFYEQRVAPFWLVLASFYFYGWWDWHYVPLLFVSICFNYCIGERIRRGNGRKGWLVAGIIGNLSLLGYFKYTGFFLSTINALAGSVVFDVPHIILPLGISFFTFTQTAYLLNVYGRGTNLCREKQVGFLEYCEFVTIFPHLIAGPIIDHRKIIPQFVDISNYHLDYKNVSVGLMLFSIGLFKKVFIADSLSPWVGNLFSRADTLSFFEAWLAAIGYTFQLYFDFSGYSEMAIGLGRVFNLDFPVNFNSPYQARSIIDFWRRWHMTLGLWVKEYLYIPMGGNRQGEWFKMRNLFLCMLLIGFWHGAGWTFILWGILHGTLLVINHLWRRLNIAFPHIVNWGITFLCVMICWIFFRADNFHDAIAILKAMTDVNHIVLPAGGRIEKLFVSCDILRNFGVVFLPMKGVQGVSFTKFAVMVCILGVLLAKTKNPLMWKLEPSFKWMTIIVVMFYSSIWFMFRSGASEFLYFQF